MHQQPHTVGIFTEVAPKYELLNTLMTAGQDRAWRKKMLATLEAALGKKPQDLLDLATGTGDVPRMMAQKWPEARVVGTDPTPAMLQVARDKSMSAKKAPLQSIQWAEGVAENISFSNESFDAVTIAFGFRNVAEDQRQKCMDEVFRVLRPGGVFAVLELGQPKDGAWRKTYRLLLRYGMPRFASLFGPKDAYEYLAESVLEFPPPENIRRLFSKAGFLPFAPRPLTTGMTWLYVGKKPHSPH